MPKVYIVAELGTSCNDNIVRAKMAIDQFAHSGANAIKFQSWDADLFYHPSHKAYDRIKELNWKKEWYQELKDTCDFYEIDFLCTPYDIPNARALREVNPKYIKVSSSDLIYYRLLKELASYKIPIIMSTGMADWIEISRALSLLRINGTPETILLHCVAGYPILPEDVDLDKVNEIKYLFQVPVGYSDHSEGYRNCIEAVKHGAIVIEKHVSMKKEMSPYEIGVSNFASMVTQIRKISIYDWPQSKEKKPLPEKLVKLSEYDGLYEGRRGLYVTKDLQEGHVLTKDDLVALRPRTRNIDVIGPEDEFVVIGKTLNRDMKRLEILLWPNLI